MPTIDAGLKDLQMLTGKKLSKAQFEDALLYAKSELDGAEGDALKIDVKDTNRPDLWSAEGIARELRARLGKEKGLPKIKIVRGKTKLIVEQSVKGVRPIIAACVARNVKVNENFLVQMIQLQEKVSETFGRRRAEVAIGLYDFDKMKPPVYYRAYKPRDFKFVPLEFKNALDLDEVLELHPKGQEYAHLLKGAKQYPIVIDSAGTVASMPPIINSEATGKVSAKTKNLFLEVTGMKPESVMTALNVMAAALAERGAKLETVDVIYKGGKKWVTPDFTPKKIEVGMDYIKKMSGLELSNSQIVDLLKRARYEVKLKGNTAEVSYPAYRNDILHAADVVEDVLVSYGYNEIEPAEIKMPVRGSERAETLRKDRAREACIGLGLQEVLTFTTTSREKQEGKIGLKGERFAEIENYMSLNYQVFRKRIFPELLEFLNRNKRYAYPQNIFEVGKVVVLNPKAETKVDEPEHLCVVLCGKGVNFTAIKSHLDSVYKNLGIEYTLRETTEPFLENGRSAEIGAGGKKGIIGELNQATLKKFGLEMPVALFEMEV
ncbi:MAG: phenylalanine--tRNA ligase subunit beta [Candidatus Diapherotrites archaeon]|nr:phenylalanine--tRNA ligase subunit beta [Candidatus Micrarchaeota archaeon]MBU1939554.1 phenylalanine--tRNA ligase subunit beta [Candidatus Micrarchaeota archaeon]